MRICGGGEGEWEGRRRGKSIGLTRMPKGKRSAVVIGGTWDARSIVNSRERRRKSLSWERSPVEEQERSVSKGEQGTEPVRTILRFS